jgi:hypothetical protein
MALRAPQGLVWFAILIAPVLPLRDHISDYYLVGPALGVAFIAAASARRPIAWVAFAVYLGVCIPQTWRATEWHYERSMKTKDLVSGVVRLHREHPSKDLVLHGVTPELFYAAVADLPFQLYGFQDQVFLARGFDELSRKYERPPDRTAEFIDVRVKPVR